MKCIISIALQHCNGLRISGGAIPKRWNQRRSDYFLARGHLSYHIQSKSSEYFQRWFCLVQRFRRRRFDLLQNFETDGILLVGKVHLRSGCCGLFITAPLLFAAAVGGGGGGGCSCSFHMYFEFMIDPPLLVFPFFSSSFFVHLPDLFFTTPHFHHHLS